MEKKYQIFISSTYEDLKEERKKVQDTILEMYHFPIGMEMFSAADEEQWEIIQETIDSSDYYVLIIGHRYGSVIEDGEYVGISYTQKEFRYALKKKIPILAFLIDDKVPVTPDKIEVDIDKKNKLEEFKKEVLTGRTVQWWTSKDDLANKVMNALNKQISRGKRPGWIRADAIDIEETQNELVKMSKKIRKLEEENEELRKNVVIRKPELRLDINDGEYVKIQYVEYNMNAIDLEYMKLSVDDVPEDIKGNITQEMIEEYNNKLPSKEALERYKEERRFYQQAQQNPFDIDFTIRNDGNMKAKDIYIEIQFPEELVIYKQGIDISVPKMPEKGENPIDTYYMKKVNSVVNGLPKVNLAFGGKLFDIDSINQIDFPNKHYYNEDNSISIRMEDLMTGYTWSIRDKYFLVPRKKGVFEIVCTFMCEEYEQEIEQIIEVVVE